MDMQVPNQMNNKRQEDFKYNYLKYSLTDEPGLDALCPFKRAASQTENFRINENARNSQSNEEEEEIAELKSLISELTFGDESARSKNSTKSCSTAFGSINSTDGEELLRILERSKSDTQLTGNFNIPERPTISLKGRVLHSDNNLISKIKKYSMYEENVKRECTRRVVPRRVSNPIFKNFL